MNHLKNFKTYIQAIVPMKEHELRYYKQFADFLKKYEEAQQKTSAQIGANDDKLVKLASGDSAANLN